MITVRLYTGQVLTFPDGTPESEIRDAARRAVASSSSGTKPATLDLSAAKAKPDNVWHMDAGPAAPKIQFKETQPQPQPQAHDASSLPSGPGIPNRPADWWRSITGSSDPAEWRKFARNRQLIDAERTGGIAGMKSLGFEDRTTYYENPTTGERILKRRRIGNLPDLEAAHQYGAQNPNAAWVEEGRGIFRTQAKEEPVAKEFVRGVPARIAESESGMVLPIQVVEAGVKGLAHEVASAIAGPPVERSGQEFRRGASEAWHQSPLTQGAETVRREIAGPARERLVQATIDAGMSPEAAASLDTAQLVAGEALNPGNYYGLEALHGATNFDSTAARTAALESRGGSRALEDIPGIATREYGRGAAASELEQARAARSGDYLPGAHEPLIYRDPETHAFPQTKGLIPDTIRQVQGRPWRTYAEDYYLKEPTSPSPKPRQMSRESLPIKLTGGDKTEREHVLGLWDYASKRYPTIASSVSEVQIIPGNLKTAGAFFDRESRVLGLSADADLGTMMHELVHAAQTSRGKPTGIHAREPYSVRAGDVYSRIPQPLPREELRIPTSTSEFLPGTGLSKAGSFASGANERDLSKLRVASGRLMDRGTEAGDMPWLARPSIEPGLELPPGEVRSMPRSLSAEGLAGPVGRNETRLAQDASLGMRGDPNDIAELYNTSVLTADRAASIGKLTNRGNFDLLPGENTRLPTTPGSESLGSPITDDELRRRLTPLLPDEIIAERLGWKLPTGSPRTTQPVDPIRTPEFQTNLAAQVGGPDVGYFGDPEVAGYIIEKSDQVFRELGPPQSWDTLEYMASQSGITKEQLLQDKSHWAVLPPEHRVRLTQILRGINEIDIPKIEAKVVAGTATDADKADLLRLIDTRGDLIRLGAKTGTAYARALNSIKQEARLALGSDMALRQKLYRQYASQIDKEKPLLSALARLNPSDPNELQTFLRAVNRPTFREYLQEYWVSSVLSGPATHERNFIGNVVNAAVENYLVRPLAAGFDAARVVGTDQAREVFLREVPEAWIGFGAGIPKGLRRGLEILKRGYDIDTMQGKLFPVRSAFARSQNRIVREVVGPIVTAPLRLLSASDALFKTMNFTAEIYAQAARIASKEAAKSGHGFDWITSEIERLVTNPTDEMVQAADRFALKATFNDEASMIGKAFMNLRDVPNAAATSRVGKAGIETYRTMSGFLLPFIKIADRLMVRGLEYSPIGALKSIGARQAGNMAEAAELAAKSAMGSTVMAYAASLAMQGRLTAGAPIGEGEKAAFYAAKKQPWSVRTESGEWIPYGNLQPVGTPFAIAAAAWKGWVEHGDSPDPEALGHAAAEVGNYMTEQSYMDALSKFLEAVHGSEAERGGAFSDLAANTAWGLAPYSGFTRTVAKAIDPRVIDTKTIGQRIEQNIPGMSGGMTARLTPWGEEIVPIGGRSRAVIASGSILAPSHETHGTNVQSLWQSPPPNWAAGTIDTDFETPLSPAEEAQFRAWKKQYAPNDDGLNYDYPGAFKAGLTPGPDHHWPDTFKKPNHPTFSTDSMYAQLAPRLAGTWNGDKYTPHPDLDLDSELQRLGMPLGRVGNSISDPGHGSWKLGQEDWSWYQQIAGRMSKVMVTDLFSTPGYTNWDVETQRKAVSAAIADAREYARNQILARKYGLSWAHFGDPRKKKTLADIESDFGL